MATVKHASETWTRKLVSNLEGALLNAVATVNAYAQSVEAAMRRHVDRRDNPHGVTRAQIGLGNVDNTADMDKPLSRPQGDALSRAVADAAAPKADKAKFAAFNAIVLPDGATQNQQAAALKAVIDALRSVALAAALAVAAPAFGDVAGGTQWGDVPPATRMDDVCRLFAEVLGYADATNAIAGAVKVGETRDLSDVAAGGGVALNWIVGADTVFGVRVRDGRWRITTVDGDLATEDYAGKRAADAENSARAYADALYHSITNDVEVWEFSGDGVEPGAVYEVRYRWEDFDEETGDGGWYVHFLYKNGEKIAAYGGWMDPHDEVDFHTVGIVARYVTSRNRLGLARLKDIQHLTNVYTKAEVDSKVENAVLPTNPAFSNAVLAVGLNIDTNSVAVLNEIASTFGGFPIEGTATTVGGLLAALAAAVAWLKKNKVGSFASVGGASATVENGVAKLEDFFTESNSLLNGRLAYSRNATGLKDRAFNMLSFDGTEFNLSTALEAVTPTASGQPRDLLIVATATAATTIGYTAGTIKGDKPTIDGAGTWLITLTEYAANTWYCRQIKMEDAA